MQSLHSLGEKMSSYNGLLSPNDLPQHPCPVTSSASMSHSCHHPLLTALQHEAPLLFLDCGRQALHWLFPLPGTPLFQMSTWLHSHLQVFTQMLSSPATPPLALLSKSLTTPHTSYLFLALLSTLPSRTTPYNLLRNLYIICLPHRNAVPRAFFLPRSLLSPQCPA